MLAASASVLLAARAQVPHLQTIMIVTRRDAVLLAEAQVLSSHERVEIVINESADDGMAGSIASGVAVTREASAWLVALADMPFIQPATVVELLSQPIDDSSIIIPTYQGQRGHPVLFGRAYFAELIQLTGDAGARNVVERYASHVRLLPVADAGVLRDVDTPAALGTPGQVG
jgi:molybdenum cofactor cytidylyltransferase